MRVCDVSAMVLNLCVFDMIVCVCVVYKASIMGYLDVQAIVLKEFWYVCPDIRFGV